MPAFTNWAYRFSFSSIAWKLFKDARFEIFIRWGVSLYPFWFRMRSRQNVSEKFSRIHPSCKSMDRKINSDTNYPSQNAVLYKVSFKK